MKRKKLFCFNETFVFHVTPHLHTKLYVCTQFISKIPKEEIEILFYEVGYIYESLCMCIYLCEVYLSDSVKFCGANPRVSGNRGFLIFNQEL